MEFTKDIYFNNSLTSGKECKITYSGYLFQNGSNNLNIVYGFGENWNNTTTQPMVKTQNGFETNIKMLDFDTFNFCFSNENNIWDNNNSFNYISPILPDLEEISTNNDIEIETEKYSVDSLLDEILGNTIKQDITSEKENNSIDKILESITIETAPEIEQLFNDLFFNNVKEDNTTLPNNKITVSIEPELAEELKEVENVVNNLKNENIVVEDKQKFLNLFEDLFNTKEPTFFENSCITNKSNDNINLITNNLENTQINDSTTENFIDELLLDLEKVHNNSNSIKNFLIDDSTINNIFDELFEENKNVNNDLENANSKVNNLFDELFEDNKDVINKLESNVQINSASFNLDGLVSDLLEPVISSESFSSKNETSLFEDIKNNDKSELETSLTIVDSNNFMVSPRRLGSFYKFRKRIRLALLKIAKIPKDFVKQLGL